MTLNHTHNPAATSWLASANETGCDFPIQNLPFGVFKPKSAPAPDWRAGIAIGSDVLDLPALAATGLLQGLALSAAQAGAADALATTPTSTPRCTTPPTSASSSAPTTRCCPTTNGCPLATTAAHPALGVGPGLSSAPRARPCPPAPTMPVVGPCKRLDIELELGVFVGQGNALGEPVPMTRPKTTCSASACSTTGRRATSRRGNTSRSARSCPRTSPPRFPPGW
jgi:fumarylacetoacetase